MTRSLKSIASLLLFPLVAGLGSAYAADADSSSTVTIHRINAAGAQRVIATAEREAQARHAASAIAVVDESGTLVAFLDMDGVRPGSPDLAIGKARTSALLQRPSAETETNVNNGRTGFVTAGLMTVRGGVPLLVNGEVVGAVGVAGINKDNDVAIAEAAAAGFAHGAPQN